MKTKALPLLSVIFLAVSLVTALLLQLTFRASALEWKTLENTYFIINYCEGYENDATKTLNSAMEVRSITLQKYPHAVDPKVIIFIYPNRTTLMDEKGVPTAKAEVGATGGIIYILCPSWEGDWGGYEQLDEPFRGVLNHEYVHVPFYNDLYSKVSGYKDPPSWFSQGIAEYISQNYLPPYEQRVRDAVEAGYFTPEAEPYSWGLYILEYMYAQYGQNKVINLIRSDDAIFKNALSTELGVSPSDFENGYGYGWKAYLTAHFLCDLNNDRTVDIFDIMILVTAYDSRLGDENWNAVPDINKDGIVDIYDVVLFAPNFGKRYP